MLVRCNHCQRAFEVDERRAAEAGAARCECGARLPLSIEERALESNSRRLGNYVLVRRIAVGGMGEIYYAKLAGAEGFERAVAIKRLLPHLSADRSFINMLIKEAKLTVLLHHPNIVQIFDLAKAGDEYYIAMEYVPGVTVGHLLETCHLAKTRLPWELAVHITMQVLQGLSYAHTLRDGQGEPMRLLHRDITPQNILVTQRAWVKITDFGIAKARNEISTTSPGMIRGKLGYIAPEQLTGGAPDERLDVFCAGILLWESLANRRLFKGVDEVDTFRLIARAQVPALGDYRSDVPQTVENALRKSLARDPDQRLLSAEAFWDALAQAIFPQTADDFAGIARRYLETHSEYFENTVTASTEIALPPELQPTPPGKDEALRPITELARAPKRGRLAWVAGTTFILLAAAAVTGYAALKRTSSLPSVAATVPTPPNPEAAAPTTQRATANPGPSTRKSEPLKPLTKEEIQATVSRASAAIAKCIEGLAGAQAPSQVLASIAINARGEVTKAELSPSLPLPAVEDCLRRALKKMRFRRQPQELLEATIPIKIQVL